MARVTRFASPAQGGVQAFQKVPALNAIAPHQSEPPLMVTQLVVLALFVVLAIIATGRFRIDASAVRCIGYLGRITVRRGLALTVLARFLSELPIEWLL